MRFIVSKGKINVSIRSAIYHRYACDITTAGGEHAARWLGLFEPLGDARSLRVKSDISGLLLTLCRY